MTKLIRRASSAVGRSWCQAMHPDPMWPINGSYQCPKCQRKYAVPWEKPPAPAKLEDARVVKPAEATQIAAGAPTVPAAGLTAAPPA